MLDFDLASVAANPSFVFWTAAEHMNRSRSKLYGKAQEAKTTSQTFVDIDKWSQACRRKDLNPLLHGTLGWASFGPFTFDGWVFSTGHSADQMCVLPVWNVLTHLTFLFPCRSALLSGPCLRKIEVD